MIFKIKIKDNELIKIEIKKIKYWTKKKYLKIILPVCSISLFQLFMTAFKVQYSPSVEASKVGLE